MSLITLELPNTLHHQLELEAKNEGVMLDRYILYALMQQLSSNYTIHIMSDEDVKRQRERFDVFLNSGPRATEEEIEQVFAEREHVAPEPELTPDIVARFEELIAQKRKQAAVHPA